MGEYDNLLSVCARPSVTAFGTGPLHVSAHSWMKASLQNGVSWASLLTHYQSACCILRRNCFDGAESEGNGGFEKGAGLPCTLLLHGSLAIHLSPVQGLQSFQNLSLKHVLFHLGQLKPGAPVFGTSISQLLRCAIPINLARLPVSLNSILAVFKWSSPAFIYTLHSEDTWRVSMQDQRRRHTGLEVIRCLLQISCLCIQITVVHGGFRKAQAEGADALSDLLYMMQGLK